MGNALDIDSLSLKSSRSSQLSGEGKTQKGRTGNVIYAGKSLNNSIRKMFWLADCCSSFIEGIVGSMSR